MKSLIDEASAALDALLAGDEMQWLKLSGDYALLINATHKAVTEKNQEVLEKWKAVLEQSHDRISHCHRLLDAPAVSRIQRNAMTLIETAIEAATQSLHGPDAALRAIWRTYWKQRAIPQSDHFVKVPIAGCTKAGGFLSDLTLKRLPGSANTPALVPHPEVALLPLGTALVDALAQQWSVRCPNHTVCWSIKQRVDSDGVPQPFVQMDGDSLGLPAAAGFQLLAIGHNYHAKCMITGAVKSDGSLAGVACEAEKIAAAQKAGLTRFGVAASSSRLELTLGGFGEATRELRSIEEAVAFADENWMAEPQRDPAKAIRSVVVALPAIGMDRARISPVHLMLRSGMQPTGQFLNDAPGALNGVAQSGVDWLTRYAQVFHGFLGQKMREEYLGVSRTFNSAFFHVSGASAQHPDPLRAALVLAHLSQILTNILVQDLNLAITLPDSTIVCATGFDPFSNEVVAGSRGLLADACSLAPADRRVTLLYARNQQEELAALPVASHVTARPIDKVQDLFSELLSDVLTTLEKDGKALLVEDLQGTIRDYIELEEQLREAKLAAAGVQAATREVEDEILVNIKAKEFFENLIKEVQNHNGTPDELPTASWVAEQFAERFQQWKEEVKLEEPPTIEYFSGDSPKLKEQDDSRRLYRRVAAKLHQDRQGHTSEYYEWFLTLAQHKKDRAYLEVLDGATEPFEWFGRGSTMEDRVSEYFERIHALRRSQQEVAARSARLRLEVDSYGVRNLDREVKRKADIRRAMDASVNALWRDLNGRLGRDPGAGWR